MNPRRRICKYFFFNRFGGVEDPLIIRSPTSPCVSVLFDLLEMRLETMMDSGTRGWVNDHRRWYNLVVSIAFGAEFIVGGQRQWPAGVGRKKQLFITSWQAIRGDKASIWSEKSRAREKRRRSPFPLALSNAIDSFFLLSLSEWIAPPWCHYEKCHGIIIGEHSFLLLSQLWFLSDKSAKNIRPHSLPFSIFISAVHLRVHEAKANKTAELSGNALCIYVIILEIGTRRGWWWWAWLVWINTKPKLLITNETWLRKCRAVWPFFFCRPQRWERDLIIQKVRKSSDLLMTEKTASVQKRWSTWATNSPSFSSSFAIGGTHKKITTKSGQMIKLFRWLDPAIIFISSIAWKELAFPVATPASREMVISDRVVTKDSLWFLAIRFPILSISLVLFCLRNVISSSSRPPPFVYYFFLLRSVRSVAPPAADHPQNGTGKLASCCSDISRSPDHRKPYAMALNRGSSLSRKTKKIE